MKPPMTPNTKPRIYMFLNERWEGRKKEASKVKQTNKAKQHSTPKAVTFPRKKWAASGGTRTHDTLYSRQSALPTELPRQLSWLGPNLTSHSTPDEQANHQLSMKEKAGVMKPPMTPNTKPRIYMFLNERWEGRKKEASKVKQTNKAKQHSTPKAVTFPRKKWAVSGGTRTHDTLYSRQSALPTELPRQLSWLGPNLTSHSTPDEQANHQLSMKEKAGVMKPPMTPNTKPRIYMFLNERWEGRKKEASKVKQTNKAKQHSTPKAVTFPRKKWAVSGGTRTHDTLYSVHVPDVASISRLSPSRYNLWGREPGKAGSKVTLQFSRERARKSRLYLIIWVRAVFRFKTFVAQPVSRHNITIAQCTTSLLLQSHRQYNSKL